MKQLQTRLVEMAAPKLPRRGKPNNKARGAGIEVDPATLKKEFALFKKQVPATIKWYIQEMLDEPQYLEGYLPTSQSALRDLALSLAEYIQRGISDQLADAWFIDTWGRISSRRFSGGLDDLTAAGFVVYNKEGTAYNEGLSDELISYIEKAITAAINKPALKKAAESMRDNGIEDAVDYAVSQLKMLLKQVTAEWFREDLDLKAPKGMPPKQVSKFKQLVHEIVESNL